MGNSNDKDRGMKSFLYGVPTDYGLTREESTLRTMTQGLSLLKRRISDRPMRDVTPITIQQPSQPYYQPYPQSTSIHVDVSDMLRSIDDISRGQDATAREIGTLVEQFGQGLDLQRNVAGELSYQGGLAEYAIGQRSKLLKVGRRSVAMLESIEEQGRQADSRRLALIDGLVDTRNTINAIRAHLGAGVDEVNARLFSLEEQGVVSISQLRRQTEILDEIAGLGSLDLAESREQTRALHEIVNVTKANTAALGGIGQRIDSSNVIATKANQHLSNIEDCLGLLVMTGFHIRHRIDSVFQSMQAADPRASELWNRGEHLRRSGDPLQALQYFQGSHAIDPNDPRNYYSAGMMSFGLGSNEAAQIFFRSGLQNSQNHPAGMSYFCLCEGKAAYMRGNYDEAKYLLERGRVADPKNVDIWFELALVEKKLNNPHKTIWYLNNLLFIARRQREYSGYIYKIITEPEFADIIPYLTQ